MEQKFTNDSLREIRARLQEIHSDSLEYHDDNPELMDVIDHLARVANMFAMVKEQELEGNVGTSDPQGYIEGKLSIAHNHMKHYKNRRNKTNV